MERNDLPADSPPATSGQSGQSEQTHEQTSGGLSDRARTIAGSTQDKLADVGSAVRDRTNNLKDSLADALDSGATKLRNRNQPGAMAGATEGGAVAVQREGRLADLSSNLAGGMSATASWLRDGDFQDFKVGIEKQVKEHPGRSLLLAIGVGYLIGKAFRR